MNAPESDFEVFDEADAAAQLAGVRSLLSGKTRVADLGAGRGRISIPLANGGASVLAVDRSSEALGSDEWSASSNIQFLHEDFLSPDAHWIHAGPFDVICCLGNTLSLLLESSMVGRLFTFASRAVVPGGLLIFDDVPFWGHELRDPDNWPEGLSPDGAEQLAWVPDPSLFSYRRGEQVDPGRLQPRADERLLRLWSTSELNEYALAEGWAAAVHREEGLIMSFLKEN